MTLPSQDARAVAEWLSANHFGRVLDPDNEALVADIAQVLQDFRVEQGAVDGMTAEQARVLKFYRGFQAQHGHTPSYQEAADALGVGKTKIHDVLHQLVDRGLVSIASNRARAVTILARA